MTNEQTPPTGGEFQPSTERWRDAHRYFLALARGQVDGQPDNPHRMPTEDIDTQGAFIGANNYLYRDSDGVIAGIAVTLIDEQGTLHVEFAGGKPKIEVFATNGSRHDMFAVSVDILLAPPNSIEHALHRFRDPDEPGLSTSATVLSTDPAELDQRLGNYWLPGTRADVDQAVTSLSRGTATMRVCTGPEDAREQLRKEAAADLEATLAQRLQEFSDATGIMYIDDWLAQNPPTQP